MRVLRTIPLVLILLAILIPTRSVLAAVDCGCASVGPFLDPAEPASLDVSPVGDSPHHKYVLSETSDAVQITITIKLKSNSTTVLTKSIPIDSNWGFSPDDDRFVYHSLSGGIEDVELLDLTSGTPGIAIWHDTGNPVSSRILFSPHGPYLLWVWNTASQQTFINIVDAHAGVLIYHDAPFFQHVGGTDEDEYGEQGWGFSPDSEDRSFVYGTVVGPQ